MEAQAREPGVYLNNPKRWPTSCRRDGSVVSFCADGVIVAEAQFGSADEAAALHNMITNLLRVERTRVAQEAISAIEGLL